MSTDASNLALFWAGVIAVSILVYVVLDGFDLGVGILFGLERGEAQRTQMMDTIAPFWDGNETWLVVIGASLYAAFPVVYAVFLGAFYLPVLLLLFGLIFRGVAFEFRLHSRRLRGFWDGGFFVGSAVAALVQGVAVGAMMRGIPVADGQYAGGAFDWLAPFPLLTGIGLVLGYALLGAGWLVLKADGPLRDRALRRIPFIAGAMLAVLALAFGLTLDHGALAQSGLGGRHWGWVFPVLGLAALLAVLLFTRRGHDLLPFAMTVLFFVCAFLTLGLMYWPYMVPFSITVADAATAEASLRFLFWGAGLVVLPVICIYTIGVYWVFRGKARKAPH
jgi:cytochrome bd ubiquinol oxidase subunit II